MILRSRLSHLRALSILLPTLTMPTYAHAEPGVAMLPEAYPVVLMLFLPAVLLQAAYLWRKVQMPRGLLLRRLLSANSLAILIGFPLVWLVVLILQVTAELFVMGAGAASYPPFPIDSSPIAATAMTAAWLFPGARAYGWMLPLAFILLLFVAWPVAWYIEWFWLRGRTWPIERAMLRRWLRRANWLGFTLLLVAGPVLLYLLA